MPEDYVKKVFYKNVNVGKNNIEPEHIVRMHNFFDVSYKAMLKRLIQLNLCSPKRYNRLIEIASLENKDQLQALTKEEGFDIDLIIPSKANQIPAEYLIYTKANYESGKIDQEEYEKALAYVGGGNSYVL